MKLDKIVCECTKIRVKDIVEAINQGAKTIDEIETITKASTCCGRCEEYFINVASDLLEEMLERSE